MAYKVSLTPKAKADIQDIFTYIYERSPQAAGKWFRLLHGQLRSLEQMPARCSVIPEAEGFGDHLRQLLHGKRPGVYRVVFRIVEERQEVHVLTVRHGAKKPFSEADVKRFLEP